MMIIQIPTGSRDHEIIVLIVTCVLLTFLAFSVAKCVRRRINQTFCGSDRKRTATTESGGEEEEEEEEVEENERPNENANQADDSKNSEKKDLNPKS